MFCGWSEDGVIFGDDDVGSVFRPVDALEYFEFESFGVDAEDVDVAGEDGSQDIVDGCAEDGDGDVGGLLIADGRPCGVWREVEFGEAFVGSDGGVEDVFPVMGEGLDVSGVGFDAESVPSDFFEGVCV